MRNISTAFGHLRRTSCTISLPTSVRVVSFDAMDTVITMSEPFNIVYSRVLKDFGFYVDPPRVAATFSKYMESLSSSYPCFGWNSIGDYEWWKRVIQGCLTEACVSTIPSDDIAAIARRLFGFYTTTNAWRIVDPELENVITKLRERGIGTAIVSNFDTRLRQILLNMNIHHLFDVVVASGEHGVEKPDPNIFKIITDHYGLSSPSELLHVGDSYRNDYQGAKNFGAHAILFEPYGKNRDVFATRRIMSFTELNVE
ncbi:unnamed protein product [Nippostrongylus brasiliensis]|uniref:Haloacid dehalogenase-like hydrolase domain-containing protein 3 n=1 Tax=Nippostrongylus brasiliensis TaxID=27835 RepID=A0A0N4XYB1_NIPBR|nr:unnamed protein product [Nippostrongylus brasiliensis]